jgi:orotate phosphoribosyltransferase
MIVNEETALKTAEYLLQIKAIKLNPKQPFTWASGWKSPIYCDNRKTLSYPKIRTYIRQQFAAAITEQYGKPEVVVGVATGGIANGALVAQELGVGFAYVRSSSKDHGLENLIEGVVEAGQSVVVCEDLISTGGSSLKAVEALRNAGCTVMGMVAIFSYGFKVAEDAFKKAKCPLVTLSDYNSLLLKAVDSDFIEKKDLDLLSKWRESPDKWGR